MQQGVEIGLGKQFTENFKAPLSTSHAHEPVVDDGYLHGISSGTLPGRPSLYRTAIKSQEAILMEYLSHLSTASYPTARFGQIRHPMNQAVFHLK
jgi:hypothetical protein